MTHSAPFISTGLVLGMYRIVNFTIRPEPDSTKVAGLAATSEKNFAVMPRDSFMSHTLHTATVQLAGSTVK